MRSCRACRALVRGRLPHLLHLDSAEAPPQDSEPPNQAERAELVLEDRFSMVPEWVLDAD